MFKPGDLVTINQGVNPESGGKPHFHLYLRPRLTPDWRVEGNHIIMLKGTQIFDVLEVLHTFTNRRSIIIWYPKYSGYAEIHTTWLKYYNPIDKHNQDK